MIFNGLIHILLSVPIAIFNAFRVEELPFGLDQYLVLGGGYFTRISSVFPPLHTIMNIFLWYAGVLAIVKLINLVLGSRSPVQHL